MTTRRPQSASAALRQVTRSKRKAPVPDLITMDLLGIGKDGNLYVWEEGATVQPVERFPRDRKCIEGGHYVLERNGKAVTAHCSNTVNGQVSVQWMCGGIDTYAFPVGMVERMLLGRVVPDPVKAAEVLEAIRRLSADLDARQTAPHRRRGKA